MRQLAIVKTSHKSIEIMLYDDNKFPVGFNSPKWLTFD